MHALGVRRFEEELTHCSSYRVRRGSGAAVDACGPYHTSPPYEAGSAIEHVDEEEGHGENEAHDPAQEKETEELKWHALFEEVDSAPRHAW